MQITSNRKAMIQQKMTGNKGDDHRHSQSADAMRAISNALQELGTRTPSGVPESLPDLKRTI